VGSVFTGWASFFAARFEFLWHGWRSSPLLLIWFFLFEACLFSSAARRSAGFGFSLALHHSSFPLPWFRSRVKLLCPHQSGLCFLL
jgi:hypothetical protein